MALELEIVGMQPTVESAWAEALVLANSAMQARLGQILLTAGNITQAQLDLALAEQAKDKSKRIGQILRDLGFIAQETLTASLGRKMGIPFLDVSALHLDKAALSVLPPEKSAPLDAIAVGFHQGRLVVAMANPLDWEKQDYLTRLAGRALLVAQANKAAIRGALVEAQEKLTPYDAYRWTGDHHRG